MREPLLNYDGENLAVRAFLLLYGTPGTTVGDMRFHMQQCGFPHWPEWAVAEHSAKPLTKAGAQLWLRHLFALEDVKPTSKPFASRRRLGHRLVTATPMARCRCGGLRVMDWSEYEC